MSQQITSTNPVFERINEIIAGHEVVLFMKGVPDAPMCGFSATVVNILRLCGQQDFTAVNVLDDDEIRQGIKDYTNWPTIPQLYIKGQFVGGCDICREMFDDGSLRQMLSQAEKTGGGGDLG